MILRLTIPRLSIFLEIIRLEEIEESEGFRYCGAVRIRTRNDIIFIVLVD